MTQKRQTDEDRIEYVVDRKALVESLGETTGADEVGEFLRKKRHIEELKNSIAIFRKKVIDMELELRGLEAGE